jgi:ABC-type branched-subunit amino acid transport system substrate-binding protein
LQQTLSNVSFQATGATGKIRFQPNGDRKDPQIQLIQVQRAKQNQSVFVPLSIRP